MDLGLVINHKNCMNIIMWIHFVLLLTASKAASYTSSKHFNGRSSTQNMDVFTKDILMPNVQPTKHDAYFCTVQSVEPKDAYIVQLEAKADVRKAHHILLFGCESISQHKLNSKYWECEGGALCEGMKILFAWAKNAAPTSLPKDVGFRIGGESKINHLILQVHYVFPLAEGDSSGLRLHITYQPQKYIAGIFLLVGMQAKIPPHKTNVFSDINCKFQSTVAIHPFAYRVHAHKLGTVISGYKVNAKDGTWTLLGKGNPQWPQAFYPMSEVHTVTSDDILAARCTFNSTTMDTWTYIGSTANDEMCNFYIMYYTDAEDGLSFDSCMDMEFTDLAKEMPADSYKPLPANPSLEEHALGMVGASTHATTSSKSGNHQHSEEEEAKTTILSAKKKGHATTSKLMSNYPDYDILNSPSESSYGHGSSAHEYDVSRGHVHHTATSANEPEENEGNLNSVPKKGAPHDPKFLNWFGSPAQHESLYKDVSDWPQLRESLGQVTGASFDSKGNIVIFHRGPAIWGFNTFDLSNRYKGQKDKPIPVDTILTIDKDSGTLISSWGKDLFFMPHGIALDGMDNIWITDVALHQVIKYPADGSTTPLLTFGERFTPGNDNKHFCKPSSIAIMKTGEFFIADGYCNSRILKYSSEGKLLLQWGQPTSSLLGYKIGTPPPYAFDVPHRLALAEDKGLILVADRENGRIQCFYCSNGTFHSELKDPDFGGRLFAVAYSPVNGGTVYAVNGPAMNIWRSGVKGFILHLDTRETLGYFMPSEKAMSNPHDIIATSDGSYLYVAEIGPNRIWKYVRDDSAGTGKQLAGSDVVHNSEQVAKYGIKTQAATPPMPTVVKVSILPQVLDDSKAVKENSGQRASLMGSANFAASMIIMALLAIPILLMILVAVFIRLKKQGKFNSCNLGHVNGWMTGYKAPNQARFGIGNILNPHKGFDPVSMEDSDIDPDASDSDVEEFSAKVPKA